MKLFYPFETQYYYYYMDYFNNIHILQQSTIVSINMRDD